MLLRKQLQTLLEEIWFWSKCYKCLRIVCSACTVHDVPWYSMNAPVLRAVLAIGIVFICQLILVAAHEFS